MTERDESRLKEYENILTALVRDGYIRLEVTNGFNDHTIFFNQPKCSLTLIKGYRELFSDKPRSFAKKLTGVENAIENGEPLYKVISLVKKLDVFHSENPDGEETDARFVSPWDYFIQEGHDRESINEKISSVVRLSGYLNPTDVYFEQLVGVALDIERRGYENDIALDIERKHLKLRMEKLKAYFKPIGLQL